VERKVRRSLFMKSFLNYIQENHAVPLFQDIVDEPPMLLLENMYLIRAPLTTAWSKPKTAENIMDMLKKDKNILDWDVIRQGESDGRSIKIKDDKRLIGEFHKIRNQRNMYLATSS
jgi:hypothetical protein